MSKEKKKKSKTIPTVKVRIANYETGKVGKWRKLDYKSDKK